MHSENIELSKGDKVVGILLVLIEYNGPAVRLNATVIFCH
jgi:hypothetical protein